MATRSTRITLKNRSDMQFAVSGPGTVLVHGEWSRGSAPQSGSLLLEGTDLVIQSESAGIATGTEGTILLTTTVPGTRPLEFYWDNPFVGGNSYLIKQVPSGLDVWYEGGVGNNAEVIVNIAPTQRLRTSFLPSTHGWKFSNLSWPSVPNTVINLGPFSIPIGKASLGMCGGMVYSAIDYFRANRPIPPMTTNPQGLWDPYFNFISVRLYDSFHLPGGPLSTWIPYTSADFSPAQRPFITIKDAIPRIRGDIADGQPSAIGLIGAISNDMINALSKNHQVLAYSYERSGPLVTLGIYDPNVKNDDTLFISVNAESFDSLDLNHNTSMSAIHMFFHTGYTPAVLLLP